MSLTPSPRFLRTSLGPRGGRFVAALAGEQFALAEAVERLRRVRHTARADEWLVLSAADSLNLNGVAEHYPAFRDRRAAEGRPLPRYVEDECGRI